MSDCSTCDDEHAPIRWRERRWCVECFKDNTNARGANDDWVRLVLGKTAKPEFEPPVDATAVDYDSRTSLLAEFTILDEREAQVVALSERGLSTSEIATWLDSDGKAVDSYLEQVDEKLDRAVQTLEILGDSRS